MRDADEGVRFRATTALCIPCEDEPGQGPVADALLEALGDPCADVRDWAAFALGVLRDVDTEQVRDALYGLLSDGEADTSGEAAVGLARRGDGRVLDPVLEHLANPQVGNLWVEAAAELGDERLLPALLRLRSARWQHEEPRPEVLDEAIKRCTRQTGDGPDTTT